MFSLGGYVTGTLLLLGLWAWRIARGDWFSAIFLSVPLAWFAGRALMEAGFALPATLRWLTLRRWQGLYFEHGGRHLRAVRRGDQLLFFEMDILAAIGRRRSSETRFLTEAERVHLGRREGFALTEAGCEKLLTRSAHREARPLLRHLQREAFGPFARRLENERRAREGPAPPMPSQPGGREATDETPSPKSSESADR